MSNNKPGTEASRSVDVSVDALGVLHVINVHKTTTKQGGHGAVGEIPLQLRTLCFISNPGGHHRTVVGKRPTISAAAIFSECYAPSICCFLLLDNGFVDDPRVQVGSERLRAGAGSPWRRSQSGAFLMR